MEDSKESRLRAEFEAWAKRNFFPMSREGCYYVSSETGSAWEAYRAASASRSEILEALLRLLGTPDDPNAGWRGNGTHEVFACEFCGAKHGDCTQIPHSALCPIPPARALLAKYQGE